MAVLRTDRIALSSDSGKIELKVEYSVPALRDEAGVIWLGGECSFVVGPVNGRFHLALTQLDLESMKTEVERLLAGPPGSEALLETMEQDIVLRCSINKRGLTKIDGRINPRDTPTVICTFVLEAGPIELESTLRGIKEVLQHITDT